jgi:short-subunit dehydrogenase
VLSFSQILQAQLGPKGLYVKVVLPSATRTEIWERSGRDVGSLRVVMAVEELVDPALIGFDRRELVTLPSLPSYGQWEAFQSARVALSRDLGRRMRPHDIRLSTEPELTIPGQWVRAFRCGRKR